MDKVIANLINEDIQHFWHPCAQMKDYETLKPVVVTGASESYIHLHDGSKIIDGISSWWCKSLGHNHPRLKAALKQQIDKFEHVMLAHTTNETIVNLSAKLAQLMPALNKVFYASDGANAVEIAIKMSLHAHKLHGNNHRKHFLALSNSYHGETLGALSVSDLGIYREAYQELLFNSNFITPIPYVSGTHDPLWNNCETQWQQVEAMLTPFKDSAAAIVIEPILQGAGGMKIYSQDFLRRLRTWTQQHGIHLIADEIMTGFGRSGKMLACEHANIQPDFLCLGKGLTSGWLPMSAMLTSDKIYDLFYDDYERGKSFLHSHTFAGNALAASVALETLAIMDDENICQKATTLGELLHKAMLEVAEKTNRLTNVRSIGAMAAADLINDDPTRRLGFEVYQQAMQLGALVRPIGNTLYWLPPLTMDLATLEELQKITTNAIMAVNF